MKRSLMVPGSLSSALQMTYLTVPGALRTASHLTPVGKPAPPKPLNPAAFKVEIAPSQSRVSTSLRNAPYGCSPLYGSDAKSGDIGCPEDGRNSPPVAAIRIRASACARLTLR